MPRAVVIVSDSPAGTGASLPFITRATVTELGGEVVMANVPITVWPTPGRNTPTGRAFDHSAEAALVNVGLWGHNQRVEVDGRSYAIVEAVPHVFLPHIALSLREMRPGG